MAVIGRDLGDLRRQHLREGALAGLATLSTSLIADFSAVSAQRLELRRSQHDHVDLLR
ncbi:hypothetical protein [Aquamicrobium sp.]|uniref:hypothetical protein n=1 Tax=Aquamicrobium sp. TaxID=1872579 RepID=UPI00349ED94A